MHTFRKILSLIILISFAQLLTAQEHYFSYSESAQRIYRDIIDLKLQSARDGLVSMQETEPKNLARLHLENYVDFFEIFIEENESRFNILEKNRAKRINLIEKNLDDDDPYKKFVIAEIKLQWALARSKFNQLFKAGREVVNAYNLLEENAKEHPDFIYNQKSLSIIHSLIETITIPGIFKKIFGIDGSIELGLSEIRSVIDYSHHNDFLFTEEADAIYAFILFYQCNKKKEATDFIQSSRLNPETSLLSTFLISKFLQRSGQNDLALEYLENQPSGEAYSEFHYLTFMEGLCKLRKLDPSADQSFEKFLSNFNGKHYIKEAYQKLAWCRLVFENDIPGYKTYMSKVKSEGSDLLDDDKQALKEAESSTIPNSILLRTRLLYDGGYYEKAYIELTRNAYHFNVGDSYAIEFNYRLGRVSQALKNYPDAIKYFSNTVHQGYDADSYFACNAALQLGQIYEYLNQDKYAEKHFKTCLKLKPKEYKSSLHQKAKSGLQRIKDRKK